MLSFQQNWRTRGGQGSAWKVGGVRYTHIRKCKNNKRKNNKKEIVE
jgi:hypothetical protein